MASAYASAPRSLRSTGASLTRLDCSNGDEGLHYAFIGAYLVTFGEKEGTGHLDTGNIQPLCNSASYVRVYLALADSEHLGATYRTGALSRRSTILHGNTLGIFHLPLSATFHTVCLHE